MGAIRERRTVLRNVEDRDKDRVRAWRNHPTVRAASVTDHEITVAEHDAWWQRMRGSASDRVLMFSHDGIDCGVVTFSAYDAPAATATWGFYLDVDGLDERGTTLSAWLDVAREALDYAFGPMGLAQLRGEVLEGNVVMRRMNRRFGFIEGDPTSRIVDGRMVRSVPIHLLREQRRVAAP